MFVESVSNPHDAGEPPANRWLVLAVVSAALLLIVIDMTVLYTALPVLTHELHATAKQKLWIVNMYPLVVAGILPGAGTLGDRYGHRRTFLAGLVVFGLASLWAAYSPSANALIAARAALAVGAALMMPATLAIIRQTFTQGRERGIAIGIWAAVASGGAALGPVLGGLLLTQFWWGSVFLINVPVVLVSIVLVLVLIAPRPGDATRRWDALGSIWILLGLIGTTYAVKAAAQARADWGQVVLAAVAGFFFLALFVRRQRRIEHPLLDFDLLRDQSFSVGVIAAVSCSIAFIGFQLVFSQWLQLVRELTPLQAGLQVMPIALASFVSGPLAGSWIERAGTRAVILTGMGMAIIGLVGVVLTYQPMGWALLAFLVLFGAGFGVAVTGSSSAIMFNAPQDKAGMAASVEEVSYELGGSFGVALMGSLMTAVYASHLELPATLMAYPQALDSLDEARLIAEQLPTEQAVQLIALASDAFDHAFVVVSCAAAVLLVAVTVGLLLWRKR
ncbi:MFS transporter [Lampropedia puyangensis]|uniref:MFS transporter n=1 Tax=Lampropedia puyangensis TaxID=1330072 RepID=A0A4S8F146_9BURK|nr:MFS transporter [Lampropedia puyangensis]THU01000.1 MFS transporter [Lampropedia puyangensis]